MTALILLLTSSYGIGVREAISVASSHCPLYVLLSIWEEGEQGEAIC